MKKYLIILFFMCCMLPLTANAEGTLNIKDSFQIARAYRLGRATGYSTTSVGRSTGSRIDLGSNSFGSNSGGSLQACASDCARCDVRTGRCLKCKSGYLAEGHVCKSCPSHATCDGKKYECRGHYAENDNGRCEVCASGYGKDKGGYCQITCPDGCAECSWSYSGTYCSSCSEGYNHSTNSTGSCFACCPAGQKASDDYPCRCVPNNSCSGSSCYEGSGSSSSSSCGGSNEAPCDGGVCDTGYGLNKSWTECLQCPDGCSSCNMTSMGWSCHACTSGEDPQYNTTYGTYYCGGSNDMGSNDMGSNDMGSNDMGSNDMGSNSCGGMGEYPCDGNVCNTGIGLFRDGKCNMTCPSACTSCSFSENGEHCSSCSAGYNYSVNSTGSCFTCCPAGQKASDDYPCRCVSNSCSGSGC